MSASCLWLMCIAYSPLLSGLIGVPTIVIYYPVLLGLFFYYLSEDGISFSSLSLLIVFICIVLINTMVIENAIYFNRFIFFPFVIFCSYRIAHDKILVNILCDILTKFAYVAIFLAFLSFLYRFFGGDALVDIKNPDGRVASLYLFSLSHSTFGNIIRGGFIYDEPGMFSFVLTVIVVLREVTKKSKKGSLAILLGGVFTFSLAHIFILLLYVIVSIRLKYSIFLAASLMFLVFLLYDHMSFLTNRLTIEALLDSNRLQQLENFNRIASENIIKFGNYECSERPGSICKEHGDISSSPVTPLYIGGLLYLFIQVVTSFLFLCFVLLRKQFVFPALAMFLILLQRPFFIGFGYGLMIYIPFFTMLIPMVRKGKLIISNKP
ncbi:hypothetical protein [Agarivorans sp. Alg241-V36]|uniref:hypothetical protein n=1 Tax=Agarivorans sp. Alg241-V36 TaxID=2305992 RepID=UPI0013D22173|nr:hypothetical protein [Agarivorans sp. Alg241-V36]